MSQSYYNPFKGEQGSENFPVSKKDRSKIIVKSDVGRNKEPKDVYGLRLIECCFSNNGIRLIS